MAGEQLEIKIISMSQIKDFFGMFILYRETALQDMESGGCYFAPAGA